MPEVELATACGLYCGDCEHLGNQCQGCGQMQGKPFWTAHSSGSRSARFTAVVFNRNSLSTAECATSFPAKHLLRYVTHQ